MKLKRAEVRVVAANDAATACFLDDRGPDGSPPLCYGIAPTLQASISAFAVEHERRLSMLSALPLQAAPTLSLAFPRLPPQSDRTSLEPVALKPVPHRRDANGKSKRTFAYSGGPTTVMPTWLPRRANASGSAVVSSAN